MEQRNIRLPFNLLSLAPSTPTLCGAISAAVILSVSRSRITISRFHWNLVL